MTLVCEECKVKINSRDGMYDHYHETGHRHYRPINAEDFR